MKRENAFLRNEPPSASEVYFCLGLGCLEGYNNPVIIREVTQNYHLEKPEIKIDTVDALSSQMFAIGACWPYVKHIPRLEK